MPSEEVCKASHGDSNAGAVAKGLRTLGGLNTCVVLGHGAGSQPRQD